MVPAETTLALDHKPNVRVVSTYTIIPGGLEYEARVALILAVSEFDERFLDLLAHVLHNS